MKAIIYSAQANAKRIKVYIPYIRADFRKKVKSLNSSFWHQEQKLWSIVNTKENLDLLKTIFGNDYVSDKSKVPKQVKRRQLSESATDALYELEKALTLKGMSQSTIISYKNIEYINQGFLPRSQIPCSSFSTYGN